MIIFRNNFHALPHNPFKVDSCVADLLQPFQLLKIGPIHLNVVILAESTCVNGTVVEICACESILGLNAADICTENPLWVTVPCMWIKCYLQNCTTLNNVKKMAPFCNSTA